MKTLAICSAIVLTLGLSACSAGGTSTVANPSHNNLTLGVGASSN
mgnify:CR=1 FL=1